MVAVAKEHGLDVTATDALSYVESQPEESIGGIIATQVVEHLTASYLMRLLDASHRAMRPGAPIVLETINPACWYAFFSSYIRDLTHVHPVHPETLQYLLRASGFERVEIRYREPVPEIEKLKATAVPEDVRVSDDGMAKALTGRGADTRRQRRDPQPVDLFLHGLRGRRLPRLIIRPDARRPHPTRSERRARSRRRRDA